MIGINIESLDKLINVNNINAESLDSNLNNLKDCIYDLDDCYSGDSIYQIFFEILRQNDNLKKIIPVITNYSDVLSSVKISYEKQDASFQTLFNQSNDK